MGRFRLRSAPNISPKKGTDSSFLTGDGDEYPVLFTPSSSSITISGVVAAVGAAAALGSSASTRGFSFSGTVERAMVVRERRRAMEMKKQDLRLAQ